MLRGVSFAVCMLACGVAVACGGSPPQPPSPEVNAPADLAAVAAVRDGFQSAYNSGDAEAFAKLYTADAISEPNNTPTISGRDAIVASQKAMFEQLTIKVSLVSDEVRTVGGIGYDRGHYTVEATPKSGGLTKSNEGRYLVLLVKETDGTWRAARDIDNAAGAAKAPETTESTAK